MRSTGGGDVAMPAPYPQELRDDVVAVARDRELGVTLKQIAQDFGLRDQRGVVAELAQGR